MSTDKDVFENTNSRHSRVRKTAFDTWYLKENFEFVCRIKKNVIVKCKLCLPLPKQLSTSRSSTSNLKKHMEKIHPSALQRYQTVENCSEKRKVDQSMSCDFPTKRFKAAVTNSTDEADVAGHKEYLSSDTGVFGMNQTRVDNLITDFVIGDMQSLSVVEQPDFIRLVQGLQPTKKVISRKGLVASIEKRYVEMKKNLATMLESAKHVCTTADIWSSHNRSFFGMTVHWIDIESLSRRSAALGCSRFRGRHTYDAIASLLEQVHVRYSISDKVLLTITDNGSNFLKAFRLFGREEEDLEKDTRTMGPSDSTVELSDVMFVDMQEAMKGGAVSVDMEYHLPSHRSCASHTLNLVATHDAAKATEDGSYKKLFNSTIAKCSALWNKFSRSVQAAEIFNDELQTALIVPNDTRWNAHFEAVDKIRVLATSSETKFRSVCEKLGMQTFRVNEIAFLVEYCAVMQPVAIALDILQAEKNCYLGYLLPTIITLRNKLTAAKQNVKFVSPLVDAVQKGVSNRFGSCFDDDTLILAAVTLPQFKLRWCSDDEAKERARNLLKQVMNSLSSVTLLSKPRQEMLADEADEAFFSFSSTEKAQDKGIIQELDMYLNDNNRQLDSLRKYPLVQEVFLKFNTGIPSSAPVERLFSAGGQIMTPRRSRLSDEHFEMLLLLRSNKGLN